MNMSFFPSASTLQIPPCLYDFLRPSELLELSCIHRTMVQTLDALSARKGKTLSRLIFYFCPPGAHSISLSRRYDAEYEPNMRQLFLLLAEFFQFIEFRKVRVLDWGLVTDYGGHPEHLSCFVSPSKCAQVSRQLLDCLSQNTTLETCNFGLFSHVPRADWLHAVKEHPTLRLIALTPNRARVNYNEPPTTLWRTPTTFVWSHFRIPY